jgi:hypothetical protein
MRVSMLFLLLALSCGQARGDDRDVVIVEGQKPARVRVGNIVRVSGMIASGQGDLTAEIEGPGKLVGTNRVRRVMNGQPMIGAMVREFEVLAEHQGRVRIVVTVDNKLQRRKGTTEFTIDVE